MTEREKTSFSVYSAQKLQERNDASPRNFEHAKELEKFKIIQEALPILEHGTAFGTGGCPGTTGKEVSYLVLGQLEKKVFCDTCGAQATIDSHPQALTVLLTFSPTATSETPQSESK